MQCDAGTNDWIPSILQEALIESISNDDCNVIHFGYIRDTHICAGTGTPNACSVSLFLSHLDVAISPRATLPFCNRLPEVKTLQQRMHRHIVKLF